MSEPKYTLGQKVFFMKHNKIESQKITGIIFFTKIPHYTFNEKEWPDRWDSVKEENIFPSKEALLKSL